MSEKAFGPDRVQSIGETLSLVVIHKGELIFEGYGEGVDALTPLPSWSMAKSITHALAGMLVKDGLIDIFAPAAVPEWSGPGDPRSAITLDLLLRMSSGLKFTEAYLQDQPSDVIEMLFGSGKQDVGAFAASFPLAHEPGSVFAYSSGTTNIIARVLKDVVGGGEAFEAFMQERLLKPLGMTTSKPRFDSAGTFIGSSFCNSSAQDFARFGLLYLRGGIWEGRRLLPEGWVDYARTATYQQPGSLDNPYGAHWWIGLGGDGTFSANGYEGQFIVIDPAADLIVVRNGRSRLEAKEDLAAFMNVLVTGLHDRL
jgi:CubicO group peptidase (beta-lactamase class C family)